MNHLSSNSSEKRRLSEDHGLALKAQRINIPELKRTRLRDGSISPIRRSGSPERRFKIAQLEKKNFSELLGGGTNELEKSDTLAYTNDTSIDSRMKEIEMRLESKLNKFMNSVEQRLSELENKLNSISAGCAISRDDSKEKNQPQLPN